jgi:capsid portal protein
MGLLALRRVGNGFHVGAAVHVDQTVFAEVELKLLKDWMRKLPEA